TDGSEDVPAIGLGVLAGGEHHSCRAVGNLGGGTSGDGALLAECRAQLGQALLGGARAHTLILRDGNGLLAGGDLDGDDLVREDAIGGRALGTLVGQRGDVVLLLAVKAGGLGVRVSLPAHGGALDRVGEPITFEGVV